MGGRRQQPSDDVVDEEEEGMEYENDDLSASDDADGELEGDKGTVPGRDDDDDLAGTDDDDDEDMGTDDEEKEEEDEEAQREAQRKRISEEQQRDDEVMAAKRLLEEQQAAQTGGGGQQAGEPGGLLRMQAEALLEELSADTTNRARSHLVNEAVALVANALKQRLGGLVEPALAAGMWRDLGFTPVKPFVAQPPSCVTPVGGWASHTFSRGPRRAVDVAVELPSSCLDAKDHLNHRYHAKRAAYLAAAAQLLRKLPQVARAEWQAGEAGAGGGARCPALLVTVRVGNAADTTPVGGEDGASKRGGKSGGRGKRKAAAAGIGGGKGEQEVLLRLLPCVSPATFPAAKLAPGRNNLRAAVRADKKGQQAAVTADGADGDAAALLPTPQYNNSILRDMVLVAHSKHVAHIMAQLPRAREAALLLKAWLRSQGLAAGGSASGDGSGVGAAGVAEVVDGVADDLADAVVAQLAERGGLNLAMSPVQGLRAVLSSLAQASSLGPASGMPPCDSSFAGGLPPGPPRQQLAAAFGPVFTDASGWCNLAAGLSRPMASQVRRCAAASVTLLDRGCQAAPEDTFDALFLAHLPPAAHMDYCYHVRLPPPPPQAAAQAATAAAAATAAEVAGGANGSARKKRNKNKSEGEGEGIPSQRQQHQQGEAGGGGGSSSVGGGVGAGMLGEADVSRWRSEEAQVEGLVRRALGDRAEWVRCMPRPLVARDPAQGAAATDEDAPIVVMARASPSAILRQMDVGPPADDKAASGRFRQFWGDKAELRRFRDGKICEAVVWECPPCERHLIPDRVVAHVLTRHLPPGTVVEGFSGGMDSDGEGEGGSSLQDAAGRALDSALERLSKQLRSLEDVPLRIVSAQPVASSVRRTSAWPPLPHPCAGGSEQFALQLQQREEQARQGVVGGGGGGGGGGAGGPPRCMDPVDIVVQLEGSGRWPDDLQAYAATKALMGCQMGSALAKQYGLFARAGSDGGVDVLADGFAFRLHLTTERDDAMTKKAAAMGAPAPPWAQFPLYSWLHGMMAGLAGEHPSFAPTCCLAKRWLAAQMLLGSHMSEEAAELLVAAVYTRTAGSLPPPGSPLAGLLRFLRLLAAHPWQERPLVVDPLGEMGAQQRQRATRAFDQARRQPSLSVSSSSGSSAMPAMHLATPAEPEGTRWTAQGPQPQALARVAALAARSAAVVLASLQRGSGSSSPNGNGSGRSSSRSGSAAGTASERRRRPGALGQRRLDWKSVASPALDDFDVLLWLRPDAVPCAAGGCGHGQGVERKGGHYRRRGSGSGGGAIAQVVAPDASCRAVVSAIPQVMIESRPAERLRPELLTGFDPLPRLARLLTSRFGHLAALYWDSLRPTCIAIKWRPEAFLPSPLAPETAHSSLPLRAVGSSGGGRGGGGKAGLMVLPDVVAVLGEAAEMGSGLVDRVEICGGGAGRLLR